MATVTVGATGTWDYIQDAIDDLPATATEAETIELQDQQHLGGTGSTTGDISFVGHVGTASYPVTLKCVSGGSFTDNATASDPLRITSGNGAYVTHTGTTGTKITLAAFVEIEGIQFSFGRSASYSGTNHIAFGSGDGQRVRQCIIETYQSTGTQEISRSFYIPTAGSSNKNIIQNYSILTDHGSTASYAVYFNSFTTGTFKFLDNTVLAVSTGTKPNNHMADSYTTQSLVTIAGCLFYGSATDCNTSGWSGSHNGTNATGTSNLPSTSLTTGLDTTEIQDAVGDPGATDMRLVASLDGDSTPDADAQNVDIIGTSRASTPDMGCWEFAAATTPYYSGMSLMGAGV